MSISPIPTSIPDLNFNFTDSCNCCATCYCRKPDDNPPIYVNKVGELEKYKKSKAIDAQVSLKRSTAHLMEAIIKKVNSFDGDIDECLKNLDNVMSSVKSLNSVKKAHIEAINNVMLNIFNKKVTEEKENAASKGSESQDKKGDISEYQKIERRKIPSTSGSSDSDVSSGEKQEEIK